MKNYEYKDIKSRAVINKSRAYRVLRTYIKCELTTLIFWIRKNLFGFYANFTRLINKVGPLLTTH